MESTARFVGRGALRAAHRADHAAWIASTLALHAVTRWTRIDDTPVANPDVVTEMRVRVRALLERDVVDAEQGVYPRRLLWSHNSAGYATRLPALVWDVLTLDRRRQERSWRLPTHIDDATLPAYFRRQFHWQRDGYLSDRSARLYDPGVEFLFLGMADVMRRRCLAPIVRETHRQGRPLRVLDVACGTGRTLWMLGQALPEASLTGVDLSAPYLKAARKLTAQLDDVSLLRGNGEALPFPDDHFDVVTSTYLFHDLPHAARRCAAFTPTFTSRSTRTTSEMRWRSWWWRRGSAFRGWRRTSWRRLSLLGTQRERTIATRTPRPYRWAHRSGRLHRARRQAQEPRAGS